MLKFTNGIEKLREPAGKTLRCVITGDCCPWEDAVDPIVQGKSGAILAGVQPFLDAAEIRIVQWETPLTDATTPIAKSGPNLKCPPACINFAVTAGFEVALLANNHIGDFGPDAVLQTLDVFETSGVRTVGAGRNLASAARPLLLEKNGFRLGVINVAEHEFGIADAAKPGYAPLEPFDNLKTIRAVAAQADIVLAVLHGGNEHNPVPSPRMVKLCRTFVEAGASAVVNIHPHCPQGIEIWNQVPIIYSPGNFFFPRAKLGFAPRRFWWTGYLPKISFDRNGVFAIEIAPIVCTPKPWRVVPLTAESKNKFCAYLAELSAITVQPDQVRKFFDGWCALVGSSVLSAIQTAGAVWPVDTTCCEQVKKLLPLRNYFTCEAHHELAGNYLRLLEAYRLPEAEKYIPEIQRLQQADFN